MDVGCPRCHSEYELDDARVPDEGVTVKCTSCSHVFRVKRRDQELGSAPGGRVWKVRQPSGAVLICRELTVLQKWIVESRVSRDDEISLTGEVWKRLGDIPELASFFLVVDEAAKVRAYESLHGGPLPGPLPSPPARPEPAFAGSTSGLYASLPTPVGPAFTSSASGVMPGAQGPSGPAFTSSASGVRPAQAGPAGPAFTSSPSGVRVAPPRAFASSSTDTGTYLPPLPPNLEALPLLPSQSTQPFGVVEGAADPGASALTAPELRPVSPAPMPPPPPSTPPNARETLRGPAFSVPPPAPRPGGRTGAAPSGPELRRAAPPAPGTGRWVMLALGALAVAGAAGWYLGVYRPQHARSAVAPAPAPAVGAAPAGGAAPAPAPAPVPVPAATAVPAASPAEPRGGVGPAAEAAAPPTAASSPPAAAASPAAAAEPAPVAAAAAPQPAAAAGPTPSPGAPPAAAAPATASPAPGPAAAPARPKADFDALLRQADTLRERDKAVAALNLYGQAHEQRPDRVEPLTGRGLALLDLGNAPVAEAAFLQALRIDDRHGPAIMGLAEAARLQGRNARAAEYYQRYLEVLPDGPEASVARAQLQKLKR